MDYGINMEVLLKGRLMDSKFLMLGIIKCFALDITSEVGFSNC